MNYKWKITNNTLAARGEAGKRNIFMTVAGKMIKPGEFCYSLRVDPATRAMEQAKDILLEEGNFVVGVDLAKKPKPNAVVDLDDDDAVVPPSKPPVSKSVDEPLSPRDDSAARVKVSTTGSGKPPVSRDPSEPFSGRWTGPAKAKPPEPLAPGDMPERFVMPAREGTEKTATSAVVTDVKPEADKGGVQALPPDFDPDNDAPSFGGSDPVDATAAVATASPASTPAQKADKGNKKR